MASKYPLPGDEDTPSSENDLQLCPLYQQTPGSCPPSSCDELHMCRDYLLNSRCRTFELYGKCSYSHSLFTLHNQNILKKMKLSAKDEQTFDKISRLVQNSSSNSSEKTFGRLKQSSIWNDDRGIESTNIMNYGRGHLPRPSASLAPEPSVTRRILTNNQSSTIDNRHSISPRLLSLDKPDSSQTVLLNSMGSSSKRAQYRTSLSIDLGGNQVDRPGKIKQTSSTMHSLSVYKKEEEEENDPSFSPNDTDERMDTSPISTATSGIGKYTASIFSPFWKKKNKNPATSDPNDPVRNDRQTKYAFNKYSKDDQLSYLFGPIRRQMIEHKAYQIFPSGYCRLANMNEEKELEHRLQIALPMSLKTDHIQLATDDLAFLISTSAGERIFEQNQIDYGIICRPSTVSFSIEVIHAARNDYTRSQSVPSKHVLSASQSTDRGKAHLSVSDGKFHILSTDSSIDVIRGDITQTKVDMMVCVSTSVTLLNSVLSRAGPAISSQYRQHSHSRNPVLLDGGLTSAQKILFVTWKLTVNPSNSMEAQKSLSNLVRECIDEAYRVNMTSIAFPSIGTGEIGLNPNKVCESMFSAASECLHKYKMNVTFVIYAPSGSGHNQQSYQVFRTYLDDLCKQMRPSRAESPSVTHASRSSTFAIERTQQIQRTRDCRRILVVSDPSTKAHDYKNVLQSLERLIEEKTFDLSSVQQRLIDQVDYLIDACLDYHVLPRIDFAKGKLTLRGDRDSCSQCFANLQKQRLIHSYSISKRTGKKSDEIKMNMYVSMKIDEASDNGESNIRIQDDDKTIFHIDLNASEVHINDETQVFALWTEQLSASSKIAPPTSLFSTVKVRTVNISRSSYNITECIRVFEQTMPRSEWNIERIEAIENWPLLVHYTREKSKNEIIAFHGCSFSSVQSIIHYGLHSNDGRQSEKSSYVTRDALSSHIWNSRRSTDGSYYMFAVQLSKKIFNHDSINLSNENAYQALPTHLIVYQRQIVFK